MMNPVEDISERELEIYKEYLKKDGWLLVALAACVLLCLLLGSTGNASPSEESRISRVLSAMEGAGDVQVAICYEESLPCGAVVVAQGASSITVQLRLTEAVSSLLGLAPSRIAVYPSEGGNHP